MSTTRTRLSAALATAILVAAAAAAPPPVELFYQDPDIVEAVLSPSGRQLALTSAAGAERVSLAVFDLAPGGSARRLVQFTDADITQVHWQNEKRLVFSALDLADGSGRRSGAPGLFAVDADGKALRQLVRRQGAPFFTNGDRDEKLLSWNHRLLLVPPVPAAGAEDEVLIVQHTTREPYEERPLWLNTRSGNTHELRLGAPPGAVHWVTDSHGEPRVVVTVDNGRQAAHWRGPGATAWTPLFESGLLSAPFSVAGVDDDGGLYVIRQEGPEGLGVLKRYDFDAKAPAAQPMVSTPGYDFSGRLLYGAGRARPLGVRVEVDGEITVWFDPAMKALQAEADRLFPGRVNRIDCRRCGAPDMVALVRSYSDHDPGRLWLYQAQAPEGERPWRSVGPVMKGIDPATMASLDLHRIRARDGHELPVWVTRPDGAKSPLPAVVLVHGGPWVRGGHWHWERDAQFLASRGYLVIEPEMRGSTGYGEAHFRAGFRQFGQAMQNDVADALRWAQAQGLASEKACIAGASYGGYSTLMGLINDPGLYRCGVAWVALADLELYLSGSWWVSDDISSSGRRYTLPEMVGDAEKDAAMIAANSPVRQAARIKAPLLLAYGEEDQRVPLAHGKRLRDAMREAGNPPEWVSYPGEGHGFTKKANRIDFARRMEAFLAKHLQGP